MSNKINIDEHEAAALYGPSVHWFRRARWAGGGPPFIKLSGRVLYRVEDLDAFFAGRVRRSTADPGPAVRGQR
ncbi:helix-turn-helix domain-containing protein [Geobacter benzoatilyticus]|jgi:hypothetical protein|uniref:Helix-turn-helix domain-containing protein n=1 Tax=Geobacter benzoatilyticus TaxID=2815309 RepID=A0ABX7PZ55_9BACT|nr:helix-turn-helix domain-containing protein [Geobacter benzoatilyticus]QSV44422.1 helix-turn-helix domain-containing protein [Geobacter benzoatilyticus]